MSDVREQIDAFLASPRFAVVGASDDLSKYGAKVYACYRQNGREVYAINPGRETVLGDRCYPDLASVAEHEPAVSIITPPEVTEQIVEEAIELGLERIWMQPGAESPAAIERARSAGIDVIAGGPCLLVALGYREERS